MTTALFAVALLTLAASFLCSLFEAALYAITPSQLEVLKKRGVSGAERLARMRQDVEEPIAAILTINTIAHTLGSTWCGAMVAEAWGSNYVGTFAAIFTFLVLTVTEIVPKSLGVRYAETLGPKLAFPLQVMIWIAYPIARPAKAVMRWMTGGGEKAGPTEDEVEVFSSLAAKSGSMRHEEHRWVRNALRLDRVQAKDLRTPRTVVDTLDADEVVGELAKTPEEWRHSRVPVVGENGIDEILGVVYRREVLDAALSGEGERTLRELMHPLAFVPETMPANELLELFLAERKHIVALADEFGGFEGVVTLEDVLEALLGSQIVDEHDEVVDKQELARQNARAQEVETQTAEQRASDAAGTAE